jgi:hypothetical protein
MRRQPAPIVGGAGSGSVAAAALAPVVAGAAAGYRRRRRRRRERGEGKKVGGGEGMRGPVSAMNSLRQTTPKQSHVTLYYLLLTQQANEYEQIGIQSPQPEVNPLIRIQSQVNHYQYSHK